MKAGNGDDTYIVDNVGDQAIEAGGQGTDTVKSGVSYTIGNNIEKLTLTGSAAVNGTGNSLANTITGNNAVNVLNGGLGNDTLFGGGNNDTFLFNTTLTSNIDTVADFSASHDTIELDRSIFTAITTLGTLSAAAFFTGAAAHDADDRIIYNAGNGNLFYDRDGTGAIAAVQFARLTGAPAISNTDFNVVA
jgi:Ca2+-binding RTX toxin-like protein